jgi:hypothetical protein
MRAAGSGARLRRLNSTCTLVDCGEAPVLPGKPRVGQRGAAQTGTAYAWDEHVAHVQRKLNLMDGRSLKTMCPASELQTHRRDIRTLLHTKANML